MERLINGGKAIGGIAPAPDSGGAKVLDENSSRTLLDVSNLSDTKWLYLNFGTAPNIKTGVAIAPGDYRQFFDPAGEVYIISENGDVEYSLFAAKG